MMNSNIKNIVFDLGGVVFMRDPKKCTEDFLNFFSFVRLEVMPHFWNEYDRGTLTIDEVKEELCRYHNCDREKVDDYVQLAIDKQEPIALTETLIEDLKETFDNLDKFCLKLNPTKCSFGVPVGELLGFLVSARGIEANPEKIQAIVTMRKPTKLKEI
jgi:hypothetical protein